MAELDPQLKARMIAHVEACLEGIDTDELSSSQAIDAQATIIWAFKKGVRPEEVNAWFRVGLY